MSINILVADDDKTIANLIKEIVERRGSSALVAYDGEQAYKIFNNFKVDLVITDLKMPNVDGIGLIKMIRQKNKTIPIIIITGYGSDENYELAQSYGVSEATVSRIIRKVETVLMQSGQFRLPGRKALYDTETVIEVIIVDVTEQPVERPKKNKVDTTAARKGNTPRKHRS